MKLVQTIPSLVVILRNEASENETPGNYDEINFFMELSAY
jgi:hypothetical protein